MIWRRVSAQVSFWRECLTIRPKDVRCWSCCSSSCSGRVVALDVGADFALEEASVSSGERMVCGV